MDYNWLFYMQLMKVATITIIIMWFALPIMYIITQGAFIPVHIHSVVYLTFVTVCK